MTGIPARILTPIAGHDPIRILVTVISFLLVTMLLLGISGDDPQSVNTDVGSSGLDQAGSTANSANSGWSLWGGLLGLVEVWITLDLTQRVNQDARTAVYERFLRSPLGLYGDQKIGDAVYRVMHDSAGIGDVFYRGVLAPIMSIAMIAIAMLVITAQFSNEPVIIAVSVAALPIIFIGGGMFSRIFRDQAQRMREQGSNAMAVFEERLANVQLIKAFGAEARETHAVDSASWESFRQTLKLIAFILLLIAIVAPLICFTIIAGLYHLMTEVIAHRITLGDVVLLASYGFMLGRPIGRTRRDLDQFAGPGLGPAQNLQRAGQA